jgi:hypothetical protein
MPSATCARDFEAMSNAVKKARNLSFMKEVLVRRYYVVYSDDTRLGKLQIRKDVTSCI